MKQIILKPQDLYWVNFTSFVHTMEYYYWAFSMILKEPTKKYICIKPRKNCKKGCHYVKAFIGKMQLIFPNVTFDSDSRENKGKCYYFSHLEQLVQDGFLLKGEKKTHFYQKWFPHSNSNTMREYFVNSNKKNKNKIGLVNRLEKSGRRLLNETELVKSIEQKFNLNVDVTYFEDKDFNYQINFFNDHQIIIVANSIKKSM